MTADVAVRLGLQGGTAVEKSLKRVGREGAASLRELQAAAKGLPPHLVALSRGIGSAKDAMDDFVGRAGGLAGVARAFGPIGIAVAAVTVALTLGAAAMLKHARASMEFADALDDAAHNLNVTTDFLQEMRYAIRLTGGDLAQSEEALKKFSETFGAARSGLQAKAFKPFAALGFTKEDLQQFKSIEDILPEIANRVAKLGTSAEQAAVVEKLGLTPMLGLLRQGKDGFEKLADEAKRLGLVMDAELIKRAATANDEFETQSQIISIQLKSAFVDLGPVLIDLMKLLAGTAKLIRDIADSWKDLEHKSSSGIRDQITRLYRERNRLEGGRQFALKVHDMPSFNENTRRIDAIDAKIQGLSDELDRRDADNAPPSPPSGNGSLVDLTKPKNPDHSREQEQKRFDDAVAQVQQQMLDLESQRPGTIQETLNVEQSKLIYERQSRERQIDDLVATGQLTKAHGEQLKIEEQKLRDAKDEKLQSDARRELEAKRLEDEAAIGGLTAELLSLASASARTQAERRRIELEMLDLQRKQARQQLDFDLRHDPNLNDQQRAERLALFDRITAAQRGAVMQRTMGPLDAYRDSLLRSSGEISEAFQSVAVGGLETLNDKLLEVIANSGKLGDVVTATLNRVALELEKLALQRFILQPLADLLSAMFNGRGGGLGDMLAQAVGSVLGGGGGSSPSSGASGSYSVGIGRAGGGPVYRGDRRWVGEQGRERLDFGSDGYVQDAATTARQMTDARPAPSLGSAGPGGDIAVKLVNNSSQPLSARAKFGQDERGGRTLDIDLAELVEPVADRRMREMIGGGRDDRGLADAFGLRRTVRGG